jgi:flavin reductase (DIM6/NTAB) family NADH-FMN oxidoreductase RutF
MLKNDTIQIKIKDIEAFEKRYRASFINSLGGFKSLVLVGTEDADGQSNLAVFNSLFHIGASPALCGLIIRPDSVDRHTLGNIMETGVYTINHVKEEFYKSAHQTSARYSKETSEFEACGLQKEYLDGFKAPFVKESSVKFSMEIAEKIDLKINGTILLIGKIIDVYIPENCLGEDGFVDLEKAGTLTVSGLDSYHITQKIARLSYAKVGEEVREI